MTKKQDRKVLYLEIGVPEAEVVAPVALVAPGVAAPVVAEPVATGFVVAVVLVVVVLLLVVKRSGVYHLAFVPIAAQEVGPELEFCHHLNVQFELFAGFVVVVVAVRGWH